MSNDQDEDDGYDVWCYWCGGGGYRDRAEEKGHCYVCGEPWPSSLKRRIADLEADRDRALADANRLAEAAHKYLYGDVTLSYLELALVQHREEQGL